MTTVAQIAGACGLPWTPVTVGSPPPRDAGGAWAPLDAWTSPPVLDTSMTVVLEECEGRRDVATAFVAARFASPLARLAVLPVITYDRVLEYVPARLWLRHDQRRLLTGVRVTDAKVLQPAETVRIATAVEQMVTGYRLVVSGLRETGALGARALWGQLADTVVATVGQTLGDDIEPDAAADEAGRWLRAADPPLWVTPVFARVVAGGAARLVWRRASCCLAYRLSLFDLCTGCPLQSRSDWLAAASAW